jgi:hypothetical protein
MVEKLAWSRVKGCTPTPLSLYHHKVVVYAPAERADTLPLFLLHPYMYSVIKTTTTKNCRCNVVEGGILAFFKLNIA